MTETGIDLADLIRRHQDATGDSYADIAKKTGLSKAKIGQFASSKVRYQARHDTLLKLADGLKVPFEVVRSAALVTAGVGTGTTSRNARIDLVTAQLMQLDDNDLATVEVMVGSMIRSKHRG